jgi:filamentous hemagglutinin
VKELTTNKDSKEVDKFTNAIGHAIVGALVAQASGNNALSGAAGAAGGELIAGLIIEKLYPNTKAEDLTEAQRQIVLGLSTIAAGAIGGAAGEDMAGVATGANAGHNAVKNNGLSDGFDFSKGLTDYGQSASSWIESANEKGLSLEEQQAGLDRIAKGDIPEGQDPAKAIINGYTDMVLVAGAIYIGPAASIGEVLTGGFLNLGANSAYQWYDLSKPENQNKSWDYKDSTGSFVTGLLAPGRGIIKNVGIAAGGALFTDGADVGAIGGAAVGSAAGGLFNKYAPFPSEVNDIFGSIGGELIENKIKEKVNGND